MNSAVEKSYLDTQAPFLLIKEIDGIVTIDCNQNSESGNIKGTLHTDFDPSCNSRNCLLKTSLNGYSKLNLLVSLSLPYCDLKELPSCVSDLNIKELNLSHNKFSKVPECVLNNFKQLEKLDLSYNNLQEFETEPQCVQKLQIVNLEYNSLKNIPEWILEVRSFNLEEFYYNNNSITSLKSSAFHKVSYYKLRKLALQNCRLINEDFNFMKSIRTMQCLDVSNNCNSKSINNFTNCDILFIKASWCDCITTLKLNNIHLSVFPEGITVLATLTELEVSRNCLLWLPNSINKLKNLRILDMSWNDIAGFPESFSQLTNLEILKAAHNNISMLPDISSLTKLNYLDLYANELDSVDFHINNIDYCDMERNFFSTECLEKISYNVYKEKRNALRSLNKSQYRFDGPKEIAPEETNSDKESGSRYTDYSEDSFDEDKYVCDRSYVYENWDEEVKFPENGCTESDNEWNGYDGNNEKLKCTVKSENNTVMIKWPSYLFEDVLE